MGNVVFLLMCYCVFSLRVDGRFLNTKTLNTWVFFSEGKESEHLNRSKSILFSHWKDFLNTSKRADEAIFVHVCSGGLSQCLLEVRRRFLLLTHVSYSGFSCSLPDTFVPCQTLRQDMGLVQTWQPPSLKHTLHSTVRRPKQGPFNPK